MYRHVRAAGFAEHRFDTGEAVLNYAEGPPRDRPLVLLPGQTMPWESYIKVLPDLARHFHVFAVDIRGHGKSSRTPGRYSWNSVGGDLARFLTDVVRRPAVISGNSSGGVLAVWLAAHVPDRVTAIVPEDPPLFSSEWPRIRDDCYVFHFMQQVLAALHTPGGGGLGKLFADLDVPAQGEQKIIKLPRPVARFLGAVIRRHQQRHPGKPVDIGWLPLRLRVLVRGLSEYDPAFTAAFQDGAFCMGLDHAQALRAVRCPMCLLHANWFRHPTYGLVGAMDDGDVARVRQLVPHCRYERLATAHIVHMEAPREFVRLVTETAQA